MFGSADLLLNTFPLQYVDTDRAPAQLGLGESQTCYVAIRQRCVTVLCQ